MANISSINNNPIVVSSSGITDASVTTAKMSDGAVTSDKIADFSVTDTKIAEGVVGSATDKAMTGLFDTVIFATSSHTVKRYVTAGSTTQYGLALCEPVPVSGVRLICVATKITGPTLHPDYYRPIKFRVWEYTGDNYDTYNYDITESPMYISVGSGVTALQFGIVLQAVDSTSIQSAYTEHVKIDSVVVTDAGGAVDKKNVLKTARYDRSSLYSDAVTGTNDVAVLSDVVAYRSIAASNTTPTAIQPYPKLDFDCVAGDTYTVEVSGLAVRNNPSNVNYLALRVYFYTSGGSTVSAYTKTFKKTAGTLRFTVTVPDGIVKLSLFYVHAGKGTNSSRYSEYMVADEIVVTKGKAAVLESAVGVRSDPDALQGRSLLPDYYFAMADDTFDAYPYLDAKVNAVPRGKHFMFCTDQHWFNSGSSGQTVNNAQLSNKLMSYVSHRIGGATVLFGGDVLNEDSTGFIGYGKLCRFYSEATAAFGEKLLPCVGNHDLNLANVEPTRYDTTAEYEQAYTARVIPWTSVRRAVLGHLDGVIVPYDVSGKVGTYATGDDAEQLKAGFATNYYCDDHTTQTRYVVVSIMQPTNAITRLVYQSYSPNLPTGQTGHYALLYQWMTDTLIGTPDGYDVVVLMHQANRPETDQGRAISAIHSIIWAAANRQQCTVPITVNVRGWIDVEQVSDSEWSYSCDFTDGPALNRVVIVGGHQHSDYVDVRTGVAHSSATRISPYPSSLNRSVGDLVIYSQSCDAFARTQDYTYAGVRVDEMVQGTVTEQCFTVVTLKDDGGVTFTRFGAGGDLNVKYS